jgi:thiol-disulfide isomerase/thioredoxin
MLTMRRRIAILLLAVSSACAQDLVQDVRGAIAQNDFTLGESFIEKYRSARGTTPEMILAVSWLGRGALAAKQYDRADGYAVRARKLALEQLSKRKLDAEPNLPLALGASIEVQAHVLDALGQRDQAVLFLEHELKTYRNTSVHARIQKNIHLLSLEGKPAPALDFAKWLGGPSVPIDKIRGRPTILFFWAHWCGDCKKTAPELARVMSEYGPKGVALVGPTQHYGYVAAGADATPAQETPYIESVRKEFYSSLAGMPVPLSSENFKRYGVSSTPTLVFLDSKGIVRQYNPGAMTHAQLVAAVQKILAK